MNHHDLLTEKDQEKLYLVHHMHHFKNGEEIVHELHHCPLFSEKGMKGNEYSLEHLFVDDKLYHILDRESEDILYGHADNAFEIKVMDGDGQKYYFLND